ncbi:cRISPR-associated endonuclease Cas1 [Clostridium sp. CAG:149]|nr:cRISPR-associated endonuclease Cas1 [Clostridium sp. CAG:149]
MRRLLNTLYVTSEDSYLALDGENIVVLTGEQEAGRLPLHTLESVISFGYRGTSPALMGAWIEIINFQISLSDKVSLPSRERGLKFCILITIISI